MLVELYAGNYNIEDDLVNGVDGAFKSYSKDKKQVDVVWVEFVDPIVGKLQREKFHEFYDKSFFTKMDTNISCHQAIVLV